MKSEEIKHYFRQQIKKLHPDKGGNKEEFLNFLKWYKEVLENLEKKKKIEIVNSWPLKGDYFFSILEVTIEEVALGKNKKIQIPGEELVCPDCKGTGKNQKGKTQICGFCRGCGVVEIIDNRKYIPTYINCPYCKGSGNLFIQTCEKCKGKGKIKSTKEIYISIPYGLKNGDILFISKEEINSFYNLYLEISILPHPYFELNNNTLIYKCKIPFWEVILRKKILIRTLEGMEWIPSSLFTKESPIIIKNRGPFLENGDRGDLWINFQIYIPEQIPIEAKKLISQAVDLINLFKKTSKF